MAIYLDFILTWKRMNNSVVTELTLSMRRTFGFQVDLDCYVDQNSLCNNLHFFRRFWSFSRMARLGLLFFRFLRQWIRQAFILKIMRLCYSFFRLRKEVPSFKLSIYANRFTKPGNHCLSNAIFLASTFWLDKAVPLTKPFYLDLQRNAFVPRAFFSRWNLRK